MKQSKKPELEDEQLELEGEELRGVVISDEALASDDQAVKKANKNAKKIAKARLDAKARKRRLIKRLIIVIAALSVAFLLVALIPASRWWVLNSMGFKHKMAISVRERTTNKPISGVKVTLANQLVGETAANGKLVISSARFGKQDLKLEKHGYSREHFTVKNDMFDENLRDFKIKSIGIQLNISVKHWLSGQYLEGVTASYGESKAVSDKTGQLSIIVPPTDAKSVNVELMKPGFITKAVPTKLNVETSEAVLVPADKDYFISKRDGKSDLFASNVDGTDQRKIIEATGKEDDQFTQFSIRPDNKQAVLVATREGKRQNNKIIAGVYAIDLEKATIKRVDEGSEVQLLGWIENTMVYSRSPSELNYDDPAAARISSYNTNTGRVSQLAQANYFQIVLVAQNKLFFVPSDAYRPAQNQFLQSIELPGGATRQYLQDKQISTVWHNQFDNIQIETADGQNYDLAIRGGSPRAINRQPGSSQYFAFSPDYKQVIWTDKRDGQGALLLRSVSENNERVVAKFPGMTNPVRFISSDLVITRVATTQETADYVIHLPSGKFVKIVDVSNVGLIRQMIQ